MAWLFLNKKCNFENLFCDQPVLWEQTPGFIETVKTYAYYANHVVKTLCVNDFEHFLNGL